MSLLKQISLMLLIHILFKGGSLGQELVLENINSFSSADVICEKPVWSPDGVHILLTSANDNLYCLNNKEGTIEKIQSAPGIKTDVGWHNNSTVQYKTADKINHISIPHQKASSEESIDFVFVNKAEQQLYKYDSRNNISNKITEEKANYYSPLLSPDGSKAIVHIGAYIYLYSTDGSISKERITQGIVHSWSPCGNYLFYFIDESSDGHTLNNSDLFAYNLPHKEITKLTNTTDRIEMWPAISPDGKQLVFTDARTGTLYSSDIKMKQE